MTSYRRSRTPGATWFFTVNLAERGANRLLVDHVDRLRGAFQSVRMRHPFRIQAIVILPDHLHCLWRLPPGDADYPMRWALIKATFSRALPPMERISPSRRMRGERGIWQRRFWEHQIRDEEDFARHADYIHYNPVKHGHAASAAAWPYSSFHRHVARGVYAIDWAEGPPPAARAGSE
jgi:putative transposase